MQMKQFHNDEKMLMLSSSVICLSFTVLNIFERRKVLRKTLAYSSVIDINHNYNKIVKSDWLSTALISALIGQFNRTVRVMPK